MTERYRRGPTYIDATGVENMDAGEMTGEFRHLLCDVFNGLINAGLAITEVTDIHDAEGLTAEPGSDYHKSSFLGMYYRVLATRT